MGYSASVLLSDPDETDRLGRLIAASLQPGDTVLLEGQIGAGKTHLARAIVQALHASAGQPVVEVPSPTYTLVQTYQLPEVGVWHADLYRIGDSSEVAELGLDEAIGRDIVLLEWPERMEFSPPEALHVKLSVDGIGRRASLTSASERWKALADIGEQIDA